MKSLKPTFLKPTIVRLLNRCGLDLRDQSRDILALQALPAGPTSGQIVELIGTQGVGKTTLNNALYHPLRARWFFRGDLRYTGPTSVTGHALEALHRDIYFRKLEAVNATQPDSWKTLTVCRQMSNVICESLLLATHRLPRGFILDEGLFKNFAEEVLACDAQAAAPLWQNRAFVHICARDPAFAVARRQGRSDKRQQGGMFQHEETAASSDFIETARSLPPSPTRRSTAIQTSKVSELG